MTSLRQRSDVNHRKKVASYPGIDPMHRALKHMFDHLTPMWELIWELDIIIKCLLHQIHKLLVLNYKII